MYERTRAMLVLALILAGCAPDDAAPGLGALYAATPEWSEHSQWELLSPPELQLGAGDESAETFDQIRIVTSLGSDRIAVVDRTVAGVRVFDRTGKLVQAIGRAGEGPGEFRSVADVWTRNDTVFVWDNGLGRLNYFDRAGVYLGHVSHPRGNFTRTQVLGAYSNGDLVLEHPRTGVRLAPREGPLPPDSIWWHRASRDLESAELIVRGVWMELYGHPWGDGVALGEVLFTPQAHAAFHDDLLYLVRGGPRFEVEVIDRDGALIESFGLTKPPYRTESEDRSRYSDWRIDHAPGHVDLEAWERIFAEAPMKEAFPSTGDVLVDPGHHVWVEYYTPVWGEERWAVFDPDYRWLGDVDVPAGMRLLEVDSQVVLGVQVSDLGVESVVVHQLSKP